ncbi:MAG: UDP-N-acetylmuramate dehydrogenase [Pseudomonadota bacterium]
MPPFEANVELATRTTLGLGGKAAHFARVESEAELLAALHWASEHELDVRVLGGGSNIVVADAGFNGLVIEMGLRGLSVDPVQPSLHTREANGQDNAALVQAAAGEPWDDFVAAMVDRNYQGLECLSGIPGRVGATPIQNVGAYGQDVSETISHVVTIDRVTRTQRTFSAAECRFAYRDSFFKSVEPGRFIVTQVSFRLLANGAPAIRYAELERTFASLGTPPSLAQVRETVIALRRSKSMVVDANDPNSRSCGSFFVNPVLSGADFRTFSERAHGEGDIPTFPQANGQVKLSAGWLIEHAGFPRGSRDGAVGLSTKHALALVAHEGARAADIARLAQRVQRAVRDRFGVKLDPEPVFWGF